MYFFYMSLNKSNFVSFLEAWIDFICVYLSLCVYFIYIHTWMIATFSVMALISYSMHSMVYTIKNCQILSAWLKFNNLTGKKKEQED